MWDNIWLIDQAYLEISRPQRKIFVPIVDGTNIALLWNLY